MSIIVNLIPSTVVSTPIPLIKQELPNTDADQFYKVCLSNDNVLTIAAPEMPSIIPLTILEAPPLAVPAWICSNHKVLYHQDKDYICGFLKCSHRKTWLFETRYQNGDVKSNINSPVLKRHYQCLINTWTLIPGWPKTPKIIHGLVSHVSAWNLTKPCPTIRC